MKSSELIERLNQLLTQHGDCDIYIADIFDEYNQNIPMNEVDYFPEIVTPKWKSRPPTFVIS